MAETQAHEPHFDMDENSMEPALYRRLKRIENGIADNPLAFAEVLKTLGGSAFTNVEGHDDIVDLQPPADQPPARMILDYFGLRLDHEAGFDAKTETALSSDTKHQTLVNTLRHASPYEAEAARNATRRSRLSHYITSVMDWKGIAHDEPSEPEPRPEQPAEPEPNKEESPEELNKRTELPRPRETTENEDALRQTG